MAKGLEHRQRNTLVRSPMERVAWLFNRWMTRSFGLRLVSVREAVVSKDWFDRLLYFQRLFDLIKDVEGDVAECGVDLGYSLAMLASLVRSNGVNRHIWGFDSWSGLPMPTREDLSSTESMAKKGLFAESSPELVLAMLRRYGANDYEISNTITLVRGLFSETLPNYQGSNIALLHIDAVLYDSYKCAFQHLWTKISIGGIVAFDEYQELDRWPGARLAVDEFLSELGPGRVKLEKDRLYNRYYVVKTA